MQQFILEYMLSGTKEKQNFFYIRKGVTGEYRVSMEIRKGNFFDLELFIFYSSMKLEQTLSKVILVVLKFGSV